MIILGIVLIVLGLLFPVHLGILVTIGIILLIVGLILFLLGSVAHRPIGGRAHYY